MRSGNHRTARLIAIVAGLLGTALAIATPLLPVIIVYMLFQRQILSGAIAGAVR